MNKNMNAEDTKCLAIDFGTSNTVINVYNVFTDEIRSIEFPDISVNYRYMEQGSYRTVNLIPSVIKFRDGSVLIGREALDDNDEHCEATFLQMKRYISAGLPLPRILSGRKVDFFQAGSAFLGEIIKRAKSKEKIKDPRVIFTVPSTSFETYQAWLGDVASASGISSWRIVDEATACAVGYDGEVGEVLLVFDFGGGTLELSVVRILDYRKHDGVCSCSLGKGGCELGGMDLDAWLMSEFLKQHGLYLDEIKDLSCQLRKEAERVKMELTFGDNAVMRLEDPVEDRMYALSLTRGDFETILETNGLYETLNFEIQKVLEEAKFNGAGIQDINKVCVVGGSGLVPSVKQLLQGIFGERVVSYFPFEAVSRGAARIFGGREAQDYIHHEYALRHWDRERKERRLEIFIPRGTRYPCKEAARFQIAASFEGQEEIELAIFEVGNQKHPEKKLEIIYSSNGEISLTPPAERALEVPLNASCPTFIKLEPAAAEAGVYRVDLTFSIDDKKMLLVSVRDIEKRVMLLENRPVLRLE